MLKNYKIFNRPLSPHLTVYSPQTSSIFSIWHRFTAIILTINLIFLLITLKYIILTYSENFCVLNSNKFFIFNLPIWLKYFYIFFCLIIFFYHSFNGIRHIILDLNFLIYSNVFNKN